MSLVDYGGRLVRCLQIPSFPPPPPATATASTGFRAAEQFFAFGPEPSNLLFALVFLRDRKVGHWVTHSGLTYEQLTNSVTSEAPLTNDEWRSTGVSS